MSLCVEFDLNNEHRTPQSTTTGSADRFESSCPTASHLRPSSSTGSRHSGMNLWLFLSLTSIAEIKRLLDEAKAIKHESNSAPDFEKQIGFTRSVLVYMQALHLISVSFW